MPTTCDGCQFYDAADAPGPCPGCNAPLRFTLLPPPEFTDPAAVPDELPPVRRYERDAAAPARSMLHDWLTSTPVLAVAAVAVFVLMLARVWVVIARDSGDPAFSPR